MKQTINFYDFERAFQTMDRKENFSYGGLKLLFDYFEQLEEETGTEIELDVIAICCDFYENDLDDIIQDYSIEIDGDSEDQEQVVEDYLIENTNYIGKTSEGTFVYQAF